MYYLPFTFKIVGEQIDGAIKYDGEHYIIEAKWHDKWSASDDLYQFAAKVEGKMYGRGIFISINGFSPDSVQALTTGKALKTILVDGGDLVLIIENMYSTAPHTPRVSSYCHKLFESFRS